MRESRQTAQQAQHEQERLASTRSTSHSAQMYLRQSQHSETRKATSSRSRSQQHEQADFLRRLDELHNVCAAVEHIAPAHLLVHVPVLEKLRSCLGSAQRDEPRNHSLNRVQPHCAQPQKSILPVLRRNAGVVNLACSNRSERRGEWSAPEKRRIACLSSLNWSFSMLNDRASLSHAISRTSAAHR